MTALKTAAGWDVEKVRRDFPVLGREVNGKPLVYLDNAASAQVPRQVIDRMSRYLAEEHSNVHRGVHYLSQFATSEYEAAREKIRRFIGAKEAAECIFVRGCTEGLNLLAHSFCKTFVKEGDEIILSTMEHHSNIVPWQMAAKAFGAKIRVIPINQKGELELDEFERLLNPRTKIVSIAHVSNALGTINPVEEIIEMAHRMGVAVCLDAAQSLPHFKIDVSKLDVDFIAFSGHKLFGPTGSGILYGKREWLDKMEPFQTGGGMIRTVSFEDTTFAPIPEKFEAGTPAIAPAIGLGAAIDYLEEIGFENAESYERELLEYATVRLAEIPQVRIIGNAEKKASVISFEIEGIHPHDIGTILDQQGIAIRAGHHCAQPLMKFYSVPATARASIAFYNTREEIDKLADAIEMVIEVFK
ncbi:MAG TPA: cysteine desulfurase [Pyrinomonadaceae bacterium]|nr:cysteine desulfurase [Pyrinomonadaceae bacterium]